jgi:hypothetical protein
MTKPQQRRPTRKEAPKSFFPLKHEFVASLDRYIHTAGMLREAVKNIVDLGVIDNAAVVEQLRKHLQAFDEAAHGIENGEIEVEEA